MNHSHEAFVPLAPDGRQLDQAGLLSLAFKLITSELRREVRGQSPLTGVTNTVNRISGMISVDGRGLRA